MSPEASWQVMFNRKRALGAKLHEPLGHFFLFLQICVTSEMPILGKKGKP